ncbi:MAG: PilZ domain-containing protein [Nevskiales bacterium]|nr:PilZ domain-containing protein [Nevskiales bacterium]
MNDDPADHEDLRGLLIRKPQHIARMLHRLRLQRTPLAVRFNSGPRWHDGVIVGVYPDTRRFDLDAAAAGANITPRPGDRISIRGHIDDGDLRMDCNLTGECPQPAGAALSVRLPQEIFVLERRTAYRLPLPPGLALPPSAVGHTEADTGARLVDVSHHGAGALIPLDLRTSVGAALHCHIALSDTALDTHAEVRSATRLRDGVRLGLRFDALKPCDEDRLAAAVNRLERQLIRESRLPH